MRVLQLVTQDRGGPVDHAAEVAAELARLGHDSHLVGPPGAYLAHAARLGVSTHPAAMNGKGDVAGARAVAAVVAAVRPDVVHLQDRRAGLVGRVLATGRRIPSVYTLHGVPDELAPLVSGNLAIAPGRIRHRWAYLFLERLLARAPRSVVVTPCAALAVYARDHVRIPGDRVRAVPNGVGPAWLATGPARPEHPHPRATWLGVMQPVKRVPELVRAAARVPGLQLQLVGDGPERGLVEQAVAATGTGRTVRLAGYRSDPAPYLRDTDMFVLPSAAEACPMAMLQAMACGVPVIASRVGGVPEIVRSGVDGLLVDPGADDQLVAALALLAEDVRLRQRLGDAGRARVASHFGIEHTVRSLLTIYEELAG
ncbi:glycosyltransferase family 4 protein [Nocardioides panacisoli]|uniref:Glycosyltransferase family 4 protein n=1 Tax=Nocardioides panacisoli TaxID=627624 RepID=A0ABP7IQH6_9ACTN